MLALFVISLQVSVAVEDAYYLTDNLDTLYSIYNLIRDTIKSDPKLVFKIQKDFFPAMNSPYWKLDGVEVIPIQTCVAMHNTTEQQHWTQCNNTGTFGEELARRSQICWTFQWTNCLLLNLIPGDILMAMDTILTSTVYSEIVHSSRYRTLVLTIPVHLKEFSQILCQASVDEVEQTFALFLSSVSI